MSLMKKKENYVPRRAIQTPAEEEIREDETYLEEDQNEYDSDWDQEYEEEADRPAAKALDPAARRRILFGVAEVLLIAFLIAYVAWIFLKDTTRDVDMADITSAIVQQCDLGDLEEGDANTLKRYFSLDGSEYEGYLVYTADSVMNVDELLIVKVSDSSQLDDLSEVVNERLEEQLQNFDGYGTNQTELLQNAIVLERGDYFFYGVSENVEQWEEIFLSCIK
jgi:hypothetical protein